MSKYTTNTASLKATTANIRTLDAKSVDAKKISLDGKNVLDYIEESKTTVLDERGMLANDELDIWSSNISTDEDGNVIVKEYPLKFQISIENMTEALKSIFKKSTVKVENNQVLGVNNKHLMFFETNALTNGDRMFSDTEITSFNSDLSSLTNGSYMFFRSSLASFSGDLSSLTNGDHMFGGTEITSFSGDLSSLTDSLYMFYSATITSFNSDLSSLIIGKNMFNSSNITSFNCDLSSLTDGAGMFRVCYYLTSFSGDLSSLTNGSNMFYNCEELTSFSGALSSLTSGFNMFYNTKLDATSLANIIHTINTPAEAGTITIGLGIADTDEARQAIAEAIWCKDWNEVNQEFNNKNWTVTWLYNGAPTA